ncbi:hypothetical protein EIK77_007860 [Talaromyces pinophilus]|nr:hypothetical protein EIK77_007860 [Talaromyces pinophilus]
MISNTDAAGVYTDADHNTTEMSIIDLFEPAEENFAKDVALGAGAPNYMFYTPNLLNDAHDTNISYAAVNTQKIVDTMLNNAEFMKNTLILITFDENSKVLAAILK